MRKKILIFAIILAVLGLAVWVFTLIFEIAEDERYAAPSREALANDYLALDRWLRSQGHPVRVERSGNIETLMTASEGTIFIQPDIFFWTKPALDYLDSWVKQGGSLVLCLDYYRHWDEDEDLGAYLYHLGLEPGDDPNEGSYNDSRAPSFGRNVHFKDPGPDAILVLKDESGLIRLVQISRGKGKIAVTGRPRFMTSFRLDEEPNVRLCWYLFADSSPSKDAGVLFIRGQKRPEGIFGRLFQQGNFSIVIVSALVLIVLGFWSVIPVFGVVRKNEEKPGKALAERFLAEGRFLGRFGALDYYRNLYFREIRRRFMKQEDYSEAEIIRQAALLWDRDKRGSNTAEQVLSFAPQGKKDFVQTIVILKTILERL